MIVTLHSAIECVRARQLPLRVSTAIGVLRQVVREDRLMALYRHFFPREFAASTADLVRHPGQAYSVRETEFFRLVHDNLFPIPYLVDYVMEELEPEERSDCIPIVPWGRDWWDEYDLEPGWQILLLLSEEFSLDGHPHYSLTLHRRPDWPQILRLLRRALGCVVPTGQLERTAAQAEEPLCHLPLALRMVHHETGNLFLDLTPEGEMPDIFWCVDNIEALIAESQDAVDISTAVGSLITWLNKDLVKHFRKVVSLWRASSTARG